MPTPAPSLTDQILASWRTHNAIELALVAAIPAQGFAAVPLGSRGRTVGAQLAHCHLVRLGWIHYFETGKRLASGEAGAPPEPTRAALKRALVASGRAVETHLARALAGEARIRLHGKSPVRWLNYLISHESHHRGQIALALKQNGLRLPEEVAMTGLWGGWIFGK